jgi:hypothetical protein
MGEKESAKRPMGIKKAPNAQWGKTKSKTHNKEKESAKRTIRKKKVPNAQ